MKTFKIILITLIAITNISCGNETNFGNKVMEDFGSGKYVEVTVPVGDEYMELVNTMKRMDILNNDEVFSRAEIRDKEAKQQKKIEDWERFFYIDVMFNNAQLLETQHSKEDFLWITTIPKKGDRDFGNKELIKALRIGQESDKERDKNYQELDENTYISTYKFDIDKYRMKYKITVKQVDRIAYLTVIKIPKEGYRVSSFVII